MPTKEIVKSNLIWGFILWITGYVLGILLFPILPADQIGFYIAPLGLALMVWVLFNKIKRAELMCYFGVGLFWTVIAVVMDYLFIVLLFHSTNYYKPDVYLYYLLTFVTPLVVGYWKFTHKPPKSKLF